LGAIIGANALGEASLKASVLGRETDF